MNCDTIENTSTYFLYAFILLFLFMEIILNFTPLISRDALIYHLAILKLWLVHGGIFEIPWAEYAYYPNNINMVYVICLYFKNDIAPKFIHLAFGLASLHHMITSSNNKNKFVEYVQSMGVTHILMRTDLVNRYLKDNFSKDNIDRFLTLEKKYWKQVYDNNGYAFWDIRG